MLSIHYVSIMMQIFYIDWQQHWECHRSVNIGDQQNSHKWQTSRQLGFQWASFQVTRLFHKATVSHCDHFLLLHTCICCLKLHQADYKVEEVFFFTSIWWGTTQLQCIYYLRRILISRPPRVFRRFKRRSCWILNFILVDVIAVFYLLICSYCYQTNNENLEMTKKNYLIC